MSKNKKILLSVIIVIALIIAAFCSFNAYSNIKMKSALAEKYSWSVIDIRIKKHTPEKTKHNYDLEGGPRVLHYNEKWVCEYKGREFNVELTDNHYADDYQLEDIFKWCTEWLQENVDPEIVGVEIFSDIIYHSSEDADAYDYTLPWDTKKVFNKDDAFDLLSIQRKHESVNGLGIFYKVDSLLDYGKENATYLGNYEGDYRYSSFCKNKNVLLSKNITTKNGQIILIENPIFSTNTHNMSGVSYLRVYSLDANKGVSYIIKKN